MDDQMICIVYTKGLPEPLLLTLSGKIKIVASEEEAIDFIDKKVKAGFICHRFDHTASFTKETSVIEFKVPA